LKILVIDGQGGKMGRLVIEQLKQNLPEIELTAIGTNSIATASMLKAGADYGATGENPVLVNCTDADIIIGPIGVIAANSFLGEITPAMASAIGQSKAQKLLFPTSRCNITVMGTQELPFSEYALQVLAIIRKATEKSGLS